MCNDTENIINWYKETYVKCYANWIQQRILHSPYNFNGMNARLNLLYGCLSNKKSTLVCWKWSKNEVTISMGCLIICINITSIRSMIMHRVKIVSHSKILESYHKTSHTNEASKERSNIQWSIFLWLHSIAHRLDTFNELITMELEIR